MDNISYLPTVATAEAAWKRYEALARQAVDDPTLLADRSHIEAMIEAHEAFKRIFLKDAA